MDSNKSNNNKITDIVRLQRILKKWKNAAINSNSSSSKSSTIKFIKRTLSFTDVSTAGSSASNDVVPKGFLAVCVGKELKRYVIPTEYLSHQAFGLLLREAEEEFGFQQQGVLKIPCQVSVFEKMLKLVEEKKDVCCLPELGFNVDKDMLPCCSPPPSTSHHPQLCR